MQFVTAKQVQPKTYMAALIYGPTGVGKTTTALSAPAPAIIDFDGGITRVGSAFTTSALIAQVDAWEGFATMVTQLAAVPAETLIIDTVGKMLDIIQLYVLSQPKYATKNLTKPSLQAYADIKAEFVGFLRGIKASRKNLLFVAQEVETTISTPKGDVRYRIPSCGSDKNRTEILQDLDLVGYMYKDGSETCVTFDQTDAYYGKNTCGLQPVILVPKISTAEENQLFTTIHAAFVANQQRNLDNAAYLQQLQELTARINSITNAQQANDFCSAMRGIKFINDAKTKAIAAFNEKVEALGLKKNGNKYE